MNVSHRLEKSYQYSMYFRSLLLYIKCKNTMFLPNCQIFCGKTEKERAEALPILHFLIFKFSTLTVLLSPFKGDRRGSSLFLAHFPETSHLCNHHISNTSPIYLQFLSNTSPILIIGIILELY